MTVQLVILVTYLVVLMGIGVAGFRRSKLTEEDYYLAGRSQGLAATALTIMATMFSAAAILGLPGAAYKDGVAFLFFALNLPLTGCLVYVLGSKIRKLGAERGYVTPADLVADHYGGSHFVRLMVALCGFLFVVPNIVMQIKGGGYLAKTVFATDGNAEDIFDTGAMLMTAVTVGYVLLGGMRSVAWSDVIQGTLMILGIFVTCVATVSAMGGISGYLEKVSALPAEALSVPGVSNSYPPFKLMTLALFAGAASLVQPGQWIRFYAARSRATLRRSALVFSVVLPLALMASMLVGLGGRALYPPQVVDGELAAHAAIGSNDRVVLQLMEDHIPELLGGFGVVVLSLITVGVVAATMSTADSNLHALAAVITRDVYDRFVRPQASERERAWVGRAVIVVVALLALWLVRHGNADPDFKPVKMIADLMFVAMAFSAQLLPATVDVLWLKRGSAAGAAWGMAAGLATVFCFTPFVAWDGGRDISRNLDVGFVGMVINVAVFVAVTRLRPAPGRGPAPPPAPPSSRQPPQG